MAAIPRSTTELKKLVDADMFELWYMSLRCNYLLQPQGTKLNKTPGWIGSIVRKAFKLVVDLWTLTRSCNTAVI
jgi:hypothetical protein